MTLPTNNPAVHQPTGRWKRGWPWLVLLALLAEALPLPGHDSPEHVVQLIDLKIEAGGATAELYWRRATEQRALGRLKDARKDLRRALQLQPDFLPALSDLSRVQLAEHQPRPALRTINRALEFAPSEPDRAPLRMIRAEILGELGQWNDALADCTAALQSAPGTEVEWYLTRSEIQSRLGKFNEAVAGLKEGFDRTGSAVLEVECIEAMIEAGLFDQAAAKIEPYLSAARWRAAWLIRRARLSLARGEASAAQSDLLSAVPELTRRLDSQRPDGTLLADRGLAYALLGETTLAKRDLDAARRLGVEKWALRRLELALAAERR